MRFLVTGAAGFIGYHLSLSLIMDGHEVIGIDNLNAYYDPTLKKARLFHLFTTHRFSFFEQDIEDFQTFRMKGGMEVDYVIHLAAQAGVRYSLENPGAYIQSNLVGFFNILEFCRSAKPRHLFYASSSSVYGGGDGTEDGRVDAPKSLYAATKASNELMARAYWEQFAVPSTGLRFFSVYGPYGRPDLALFKFTKAILNHETIQLFNGGRNYRDCTYIDDVIRAVRWLIAVHFDNQPVPPIINIGGGHPTSNKELLEAVENVLGMTTSVVFTDAQLGDVNYTCCDTSLLMDTIGWAPKTMLSKGVGKFVQWYREYYG